MPARREETLSYLYALPRGIRPGLGRIKRLLKALGSPERAYPIIHVAGTNGKGSTSAMLFSVLSRAGYSTGLYTSPHLLKFNERIRTTGGVITDASLVKTAGKVKEAAEEKGIKGLTFFEFTTALAFLYFRERHMEAAVIETGMGGRWDATNVVTPLVSVITNVGMDHADLLGDTIEDIASEKAGIIKRGVPVVTSASRRAALKVIKETASSLSSPLHILGRDFGYSPSGSGSFDYSGIESIKGVKPSLRGPHQLVNASTAIAAIESLRDKGLSIKASAIKAGIRSAAWPGRLEVVSRRPLLILDSAHNPDGARSLKESLKGFKYGSLRLVLGIMADKDIDGIMKELCPLAGTVIVCAPALDRSAKIALLKDKASRYSKGVVTAPTVRDAIIEGLSIASPGDALCVTGSIFTVGEAKKALPAILKKIKD